MKKIFFLIFSFLIISICARAQEIVIDGKSYKVDTVANFKAGPGVRYTAVEFKGAKRMNVFFLKVDATNPYITYKGALGRDSIYGGEQPSHVAARKSKEGEIYIAGTNSDFYHTTGPVGLPLASNVIDHELATNTYGSNFNRVFAFDENKTPYIGTLTYSGDLTIGNDNYSISHVNHSRGADEMVLFNRHNGKYTHTNPYGTEVLVKLLDGEAWGINKTMKLKVLSIEKNKGNMLIPQGYGVLSGHGKAATVLDKLSVGDEVNIKLNITLNGNITSSFTNILGGDWRSEMLSNGIVNTTQVWNELHPRTAFGYSKDKKTVIHCVVDGRSSISAGATTKELAEIMLSAGAYDAMNLDGGGSSCLFLRDFGPMNKNSDGVERAVANGIYVISTAPTDNNISEIIPLKQKIRLPRYGIFKPTIYGYNKYGMLISKNVEGIKMTVDPSVGEITSDGSIFASGTQSGTVQISYGNIKTTLAVEILPEAQIKIKLDSVLLDNKTEYPIEVQSITEEGAMNIYSNALKWEVENPSICTVKNGILKGIGNGKTQVIGSLGNFKDTIAVKIEIADAQYLMAKSFSDAQWEIKSSSNLKNITHQPTANGLETTFTYKRGRNMNISYHNDFEFYSLPDSFRITFNPGETSIKKMSLRLKENNGGINTINQEFSGFEKNKDNTISLKLADLMTDPSDRGAYPVHFNFMQFHIDGAGMSESKQYGLEIKEFLLVYDGFTAGISNPKLISEVRVYPNPVKNGAAKVALNLGKDEKVRMDIVSVNGEILRTKSLGVVNHDEITLPLNGLSPGMYLLRIQHGKTSDTVKIILN